MKTHSYEELKQLIVRLSGKINKLKPCLDSNDELNKVYNRLLVQRACVRKKLTDSKQKNVISFFLKKFQKKSEPKTICDYFKTS